MHITGVRTCLGKAEKVSEASHRLAGHKCAVNETGEHEVRGGQGSYHNGGPAGLDQKLDFVGIKGCAPVIMHNLTDIRLYFGNAFGCCGGREEIKSVVILARGNRLCFVSI